MERNLPREFELPTSFGYTMDGWNFSSQEIRAAIEQHQMLNPAMELGSNICPWNCDFCFTENPSNKDGHKQQLKNELSLEQRLNLIDQAAELGTRSINFVGAGEPTIDPNFWQIVARMHERGITPIIYTEGSLQLKSLSVCERLFDIGATVVLKVNSLYNPIYQNSVLQGLKPKSGIPATSYFEGRQKALDNLINAGFNATNPTRLAFDTIICKENIDEIEWIHRFARYNNIFVLFVNYMPCGRTKDGHTTAISRELQFSIFEKLAQIDEADFGIKHSYLFPYAGGVPCTIRGLGLYIKIQGDVFDCPGESIPLGNVRTESLAQLWEKARPITDAFDGGCYPRDQFWKNHNLVSINTLGGGE